MSEVGFYPIRELGIALPGNSTIVDYGLGLTNQIVEFSVKEAAKEIVRAHKREQRYLNQNEAVEIGQNARARILEQASSRGRAVHDAAHEYLMHGIEQELEENVSPYFAGLFAWLEQHEVRPIMMEKLLYDAVEKYAGRFDFYGVVDGRLTLMDFKTNNTLQPKMGLQLAGYNHLLEANQYEVPEQMIILHLRPNQATSVQYTESWEMYKKVKDVFWWKFYRYKPNVYYRSPEDAVAREVMQKQTAPRTSQEAAPQEAASEPTNELQEDECPALGDTGTPQHTPAAPGPQSAPPTKRKRGRPRKHPLPEAEALQAESEPRRADEWELDPAVVRKHRKLQYAE